MNYNFLLLIGSIFLLLGILGVHFDCYDSKIIRNIATVLMSLLLPGMLSFFIWFLNSVGLDEVTPETGIVSSEIIETYCFDKTQPLTVVIRGEAASEHVFQSLSGGENVQKYNSLHIENYKKGNIHIVFDKSSVFVKILEEEPVTYTLSKVEVTYRKNIILGLYKNFTQIEYHLSVPEDIIQYKVTVK